VIPGEIGVASSLCTETFLLESRGEGALAGAVMGSGSSGSVASVLLDRVASVALDHVVGVDNQGRRRRKEDARGRRRRKENSRGRRRTRRCRGAGVDREGIPRGR
jgi:hypothetical protein